MEKKYTDTCTYGSHCNIRAKEEDITVYTYSNWTTNINGKTSDGYNWTSWSGTWSYVNGQYGISNNLHSKDN